MIFAVLIVFFVSILCALLEDRLSARDKLFLYVLIGLALVTIAGTRGVNDSPDSDVYETYYYGESTVEDSVHEPTFVLISVFLRDLGFGVNALFWTYALLSIPLTMVYLWKFSKTPMLTLSVYISFYYLLHGLVEIRVAVAAAFFLAALYHRLHHQNTLAVALLLCATLFHYSALVGFVIFLLPNRPIHKYSAIALASILPIGLLVYFLHFDLGYLIPGDLGGKLDTYRQLKDLGLEPEGIAFYKNFTILLNILLLCFSLFYRQRMTADYPCTPILIRMMVLAFACYFFLYNLSTVLSSRLYEFFALSSILLWTGALSSLRPQWAGRVLISGINTLVFMYVLLISLFGLMEKL